MRARELAAVATSVVLAGTGAVVAASGDDVRSAGDGHDRGGRGLTVHVRDSAGERVGVVRMKERWGSVEVDATFWGLEGADFRGFHVHETGDCSAKPGEGPFTAAGGHFTREGQGHGGPTVEEDGQDRDLEPHAGDLPSLLVESDGRARLSLTTDRFTLAELRDRDGAAVMVHAGSDNFANIPPRYAPNGPDSATLNTGDAGGRFACGVIRPGGTSS